MAVLEENDLKARIVKLRRDGEERAAKRLAEQLKLPYADLSQKPVSLEAIRTIPENKARDGKIAGIEISNMKLAIGAVNPGLPSTKAVIKLLQDKKYETRLFVISPSSLEAAFAFYKYVKQPEREITGEIDITPERMKELGSRLSNFDAVKSEFAALNFSSVSPATIIEIMFGGAVALRASDIHTEVNEKGAKIRFRVDGLLHDVFDNMPLHAYQMLVSRIKLLAQMKLNVRDEAQDGRFSIGAGGQEVEIRVSIMPAEFGETIVMRILDPKATRVGLTELGMRPDDMEIVKRALAKPNGLILNTGPTGSGKTTTLYAFLRDLNNPEVKIITLEDPIEYRVEGIEQTQVNNESGYTFANGLRAIVRQDPDVILVGEVRDFDTADIALQASLTGHLVLSTLHTNDAVGAVPRLINLGVKAVSIGPALSLVIAQRLVRILCSDCKKPAEADAALLEKIKNFISKLPPRVDKTQYSKPEIYTASGCTKCGGLGYKGRVGIFEFLEGGPDLEKTILKEASEIALNEIASNQGMVTMQEDGVLKVLKGATTWEEVEGATGPIKWSS